MDTFELGHSVTDYLIYDSHDEDPDYDHLTVKALTTWYPNYDNRNIIGAIQGSFDTYYQEDSLIDYSPNTNSLDLQLVNDEEYNIQAGYPWGINLQAKWNSGATVKMRAQGDRETGYYYQFFYGTDSSRYYWIASGEPFDVQYAYTVKSQGTLLGLWVRSSLSHQWFNESSWEWKDEWEYLEYDY